MGKKQSLPNKNVIADYWASYLEDLLPSEYYSLRAEAELKWEKAKEEYKPDYPPTKAREEVFAASTAIFRESELNTDPFIAKLAGIDWGEPCCWACGYYTNPDETKWNKAQPNLVMRGFAKSVEIKNNVCYIN